MTMPPDDLDLTTDLQPADAQPVEDTAPEEVSSDTPEVTPAPAAPDPWEKINQLAELQTRQLELQLAQQAQAAAPPAPAAWVDPFERPDNAARIAELEQQALYDPAAMRELNTLNRQLMREQFAHEREQDRVQLQQEFQARQQVEQAQATLYTEAQQYGDLVNRSTIDEVAAEVFNGVPEHQRALALQDPSMRRLLREAAAGRQVLAGKQPLPNAPARPAAPPSVQSSNRPTTPPSKATLAHYNDPEWMSNAIADAMRGK